ncbi:MAG: cytochrome ubiquinol oxidase subunit I [Planctomycetaceae bacterium]|jgi:cytochrome bd-type quinol oxidase subunit 1|nr:cytochrome ubiquinol oxidase subunit I [Planctomycetaceae bacterium]
MHYPWWYVPVLTAPMLIAFIAVIHVFVSHYAVGGGILLALENQFAVKTGDKKYRDYLYKHARFFVLLTVAYGAITGVGIWWTIALASPAATEKLIRMFVFGWAIEWVFFIIEIVAAFAMYYFWSKLPEKTHIIITWIYALAAWISLVLISGITAFMLDSRGLIANWSDTGNFWHAFFNLQFLPQTVARTGGALLLAALYVLIHAAWVYRNDISNELFLKVVRRMGKPLLFGIITIIIGVGWGCAVLHEQVFVAVERSVFLNVLFALFFGISGLITLLVFFGPVRNPRSVNFGFAVSIFILSLTALSVVEFAREAIRKPWIVNNVVLGNQIFAGEIEDRQKNGFLQPFRELPDLMPVPAGDTAESRFAKGGMLFMYHCNNCHALDHGMSAVGPLLYGESKEQIADKLRHLNIPVVSMPVWSGTDAELEALAEFLVSIRPAAEREKTDGRKN